MYNANDIKSNSAFELVEKNSGNGATEKSTVCFSFWFGGGDRRGDVIRIAFCEIEERRKEGDDSGGREVDIKAFEEEANKNIWKKDRGRGRGGDGGE